MLIACCPYVTTMLHSMTSFRFKSGGSVWNATNSWQKLCCSRKKNQSHFVLVRLNSGVVLFLDDMQILLWRVFIRVLFSPFQRLCLRSASASLHCFHAHQHKKTSCKGLTWIAWKRGCIRCLLWVISVAHLLKNTYKDPFLEFLGSVASIFRAHKIHQPFSGLCPQTKSMYEVDM